MKIRKPIRPVVVRERPYAFPILVVALLWALAMTADYHEQVAQARAAEEHATLALLDCMNGRASWTAANGEQVGCMPAETNKPSTTTEE